MMLKTVLILNIKNTHTKTTTMNTELSEWQLIDENNGLIMPWFTHSSLRYIKSLDLSNKKIFQYGSGYGDIWLADRCKYLISIERVPGWADRITSHLPKNYHNNMEIHIRECGESDKEKINWYVSLPISYNTNKEYIPDIIIIDDIFRHECIEYALLLPRPLLVIVDNWLQSYIYLNKDSELLLNGFEQYIFEQKDHTDNDGVNKWKTAFFYLK